MFSSLVRTTLCIAVSSSQTLFLNFLRKARNFSAGSLQMSIDNRRVFSYYEHSEVTVRLNKTRFCLAKY